MIKEQISWSRVLLGQLIIVRLIRKCFIFCVTRRFVTFIEGPYPEPDESYAGPPRRLQCAICCMYTRSTISQHASCHCNELAVCYCSADEHMVCAHVRGVLGVPVGFWFQICSYLMNSLLLTSPFRSVVFRLSVSNKLACKSNPFKTQ